MLVSAAVGLSKFSKLSLANNNDELNTSPVSFQDEKYWSELRGKFCTSTSLINLNNAALSPQPIAVQDNLIKNYQYSNEGPSYYMWNELKNERENIRLLLAETAGCKAETIAFTRNATEALNNIIYGIPLNHEDEIVLSNLDYPFVINSWKQRAKRENLNLKYVTLNTPESDDEIVRKYSSAISSKTKVVQLTHVINWNGQILPVNKISKIARQNGAKVVLDAAHSFAHLPYKISDLNVDYYATSLHKWLCGPFGTGFLHIRSNLISKTWPLHSPYDSLGNEIEKFEFIGTRDYGLEVALKKAIQLHTLIGPIIKYERLSYLRNYWIEKISKHKAVKLFSPKYSINLGGAIAAFGINGYTAEEIHDFLFKKHRIHTGIVNLPGIEAVRISPHIYTSLNELDILVNAIGNLVNQKND